MRRPTKIDHPVDSLLPNWGAWARSENRSGLGYSQVQYTEYIARAQSATGWNPSVDPDIALLDRIIRTRLAPQSTVIVVLRWRDNAPDKTIAHKFSISRSHLNRIVHLAILPQMRHEWDATKSA